MSAPKFDNKTDFERLADAAEKIADNLGALVSIVDELRKHLEYQQITLDRIEDNVMRAAGKE